MLSQRHLVNILCKSCSRTLSFIELYLRSHGRSTLITRHAHSRLRAFSVPPTHPMQAVQTGKFCCYLCWLQYTWLTCSVGRCEAVSAHRTHPPPRAHSGGLLSRSRDASPSPGLADRGQTHDREPWQDQTIPVSTVLSVLRFQ